MKACTYDSFVLVIIIIIILNYCKKSQVENIENVYVLCLSYENAKCLQSSLLWNATWQQSNLFIK